MDQRVKGGSPPSPASLLDSAQDQVTEKKRRVDAENGDMGTKEEDKRGIGKVREKENGEVLELLIEGRCGTVGQQQLQISGRETSCPEGNVRVRLGLQTKRTKKPPKILESYVCKPTIRTYQRQGRGALMRGDGIGEAAQQSHTSSASYEPTREQRSGCDTGQTTSKQTTSPATPALLPSLPSSSSQPESLTKSANTASTPESALTITSQGTKAAKQVLIKTANQTEVNSKFSKDKPLSVNGKHIPAEPISCSPTPDQTTSNAPPIQCAQTLSALEPKNDQNTSRKQKGLVLTTKQKRLSKVNKSANILSNSFSSKNKAFKNSSSSVSSLDFSTSPTASSKSYTQLGSELSSHPSVTLKPHLSLNADVSSTFFQSHDSSPLPPFEKKREKSKKIKKEKRKEKKSKQGKLEAEKTKEENTEEVKKKKREKGKDLKLRQNKEKRHSADDTKGENRTDKELTEKKRETLSPERQTIEDNKNREEITDIISLDKVYKLVLSASADEEKKTDSYKPVKQAVTATGDTSKSKEKDLSRHSAASPIVPSSSAPPNFPSSSFHDLLSPPLSTQEQDSRPLKKRKARRPSWTKLHRALKVDNQEAHSSDLMNNPVVANFPQNQKTPLSAKTTVQQSDESHPGPSSSLTSSSSPLFTAAKPLTPDQSPPTTDSSPPASRCPANTVQKRGRPKFSSSSSDTPPPRLSPNDTPTELPLLESDEAQKAPVLDPNPTQQSRSNPKKRGRPPKRSYAEDHHENAFIHTDYLKRNENIRLFEKGNQQQKIRRLINEMKKRKKRLHKVSLSGSVEKSGRGGKAADGEISMRICKSIEATTVRTLSALSSFGSKNSPQINVSKKGTIYMGKRRGRKPKSEKANVNSQSSTYPSLFTTPLETSFFTSCQPQPPPPHPFPSPSLTHSSGAQSPYSEGSLTEPASTLLFSQPFSLPSPSSSCTSPRPPSSSSFSTFVKKSCPCQGRHHFPFHQSSCKLSSTTFSLHHTPCSPGQVKEATPSPRSESHSEETLPSDSGIGTDNNSVSEWVERRGPQGRLRVGQGSGLIRGGQKHPSSLGDCHSTVSSSLSCMPRHTNPLTNTNNLERHRNKYRCKRWEFDSSCSCLYPGYKCTHPDGYSCFGNNAIKRQKNKHKKKHQQLLMQDPEFLAELEDLLVQFSQVHIGRRSWERAGIGQSFDGSSNAVRGKRHHSSHSIRSNIFRINLNGFYSPHPSSLSTNHSFTPKSFYACHCSRKPDRRQCSCPSKFQETIENLGFYNNYSPTTTLYHLPNSYQLPSSYQPHHAHFLLNPARFNRHRGRLLREASLEEELLRDTGRNRVGDPHHGSGFTSSSACGCSRSKHKHRHRQIEEEDRQDDEVDNRMGREGLAGSKAGSKARTGFFLAPGDGGRKGAVRSVLSKESPWLCENGKKSFSATTLSSSSVDRYKHTSLTSPGLGSSHLSSFGGGWGSLNQSWIKVGDRGAMGFRKSTPNWKSFVSNQQEGSEILSDGEDEDSEDVQESPQHRASPSPTHTNLFTTAAITSGGMSLGNGLVNQNTEGGNRSRMRNQPSWRDRGHDGLQGYSRSWGQQKRVPTPNSIALKNKRRPGRPRKHPLPSAVPFSTHSAAPSVPSSPNPLPEHNSRRDGKEKEQRREIEQGGGGAEWDSSTRRKPGRKRKHGDSPCHQSLVEDKPDHNSNPQSISQSGIQQAPPPPETIQKEEVTPGPPRKTFLRAGLYSDDYKTTEPYSQGNVRESTEYTAGSTDYALLPAPIHVGKYLRLKRIHFQLPYDVMWLWQRNQLCRQPVVPLKRKRRYSRVKNRTVASLQDVEENSGDITTFFPHLNMESLTSSERSFVVAHRVFLVRNWELTRDRQIRVRILRERERDAERDEQDSELPTCDDASGEDSNTKPDQPAGGKMTVTSIDLLTQSQDSSHLLTAGPCCNKTHDRHKKEEEGDKRKEAAALNKEQRKKRLNDLLMTMKHP